MPAAETGTTRGRSDEFVMREAERPVVPASNADARERTMRWPVVVLALSTLTLSFTSPMASQRTGQTKWGTENSREVWVRTSPHDTLVLWKPGTSERVQIGKLPEPAGRVPVPPGAFKLSVGSVRDSVLMSNGHVGLAEVTVIKTPSSWTETNDWWACLLGVTRPERVIRSLRFRAGDETVDLPSSSYFNLGDPDWLVAQADSLGVVITIRGSEGCNAWTARWWIRDGQLSRSRIELTDDPGAKWQETVWHDETVDD
jgi:hypothetical protein